METTTAPLKSHHKSTRANKLGSYLAITAGAAAVSLPTANAAIIAYNGPALTVHPTDTHSFLYFSPLATPGFQTLGIQAGISNALTDDRFNIFYNIADNVYTVKSNQNLIAMGWGASIASGGDVTLLKQNEGVTIYSNNNSWFVDAWAYMNKYGWTTANSPWATGQDGTTGFVPFEFALVGAETGIYYGWANFTYNNGGSQSLTLNNFAYENTPNTAITTGAVPEPSTLLLLALGGAGLAVARRLRKEKKTVAPVA